MNNHLKDILTALAKNGVRFIVCGGVADSRRVPLDGLEISVVSIERLVDMKRSISPPRDKDISDMRELGKRKGLI